MACVVSKHCFGGGPYSTTHNRLLKMVGDGRRQMAEIEIKRRGRGVRLPNGVYRAKVHPPYMPKKITDPWHPSGNSLCFMIQLAHLMGFDPIYCLGFTLQSGTPYFFGSQNPVTRRTAFYDSEVPLLWAKWYEKQWPGRVRLMPGWSGPVYSVFQTERLDDRSSTVRGDGPSPEGPVQGQPNADPANGIVQS